jgi:2-amino-4-hydroxy-6-hydroxymethyldihydropteridine diphosphokinase
LTKPDRGGRDPVLVGKSRRSGYDMASPMVSVYLSLGSNMGDRAAQIARALEELGKHAVRVTRRSSLYETEPVELRDQPWFLNLAVEAETDLRPAELLAAAREIERSLGRERRVPKGPRVIDIDILFYDDVVIRTPELEIPHPRISARRFVLAPLAEIAPNLLHPLRKKTVAELLTETPDRTLVWHFSG